MFRKIFKHCCYHKKCNNDNQDIYKRRQFILPRKTKFNKTSINFEIYPKSLDEESAIKEAFLKNEFMSRILPGKILNDIVDCMYIKHVNANEIIIKEGETGLHLYVSMEGVFEIRQNGKLIHTFYGNHIFGELSILYKEKRLATVRAKTKGKIWVLEAKIFKYIIVHTNMEENEEILKFLKNIPNLNMLPENLLKQIAHLFKIEFFITGTKIIKEGEKGDKFYIIRAGKVKITKKNEGDIDVLTKGNFFGELALLNEKNKRMATVIAEAPGVECLTLNREAFIRHFGSNIYSLINPEKPIQLSYEKLSISNVNILTDFEIKGFLGKGGFGKVALIKHKTIDSLYFALKLLKKSDIIKYSLEEQVINERDIQKSCNNPFVCQFYEAYKDHDYLYFLLEACLGHNLWFLLHKNHHFNDAQAKFYASCVVEALIYLHIKNIVFRDLKPENLLIAFNGYLKLTDFGFSKKLENGEKTYSFAGTPDYIPPEIILSIGHDGGVDSYQLGILIFEMLVGNPPFGKGNSHLLGLYSSILQGIDTVIFPEIIDENAKDLIKKLCKRQSSERLGQQRKGMKIIKEHKWFSNINWSLLNNYKIPPPWIPNTDDITFNNHFIKSLSSHNLKNLLEWKENYVD